MSRRRSVGAVDLLRLGVFGLRTRPGRVVLSALGIAIGIAAMLAVVGISSSSKAKVDQVLDTLGTNVLTLTRAQGLGEPVPLPSTALESVLRQDDVESAAAVGTVPDTGVYRNDHVPAPETEGLGVLAAWGDVPRVLGGQLAAGRWIDDAAGAPPQVVLGARAAAVLGFDDLHPDSRVWIGGRWVQVVGVLDPVALAEDLDSRVFVPRGFAGQLGFDGAPTAVYTRVDPAHVERSRDLLAGAVRPGAPQDVGVTRPSDALAAKDATDDSFTGLLVGIGGVALLVGGIGVANTMVITVLERRAEVGVRRALGARRRNIRDQFLVESLLLSFLGGLAGVVLGVAVTVVFAVTQGWPVALPVWAVVGGLGATVVIGGVSGLYPAARAARIPPTSALAAV
ncbi:ABC transporter permease [Curtobacterium flaccumfaciens]|uniref:ABC transporter permease n=1 Tax=Curtobacterium flaccumfaciens TaxID=2035 RepID=UPI002032E185|nr:ABC transporter permease [Curtobacterium flaccumfaciens]MCS0471540.1 ABC transporter permease [Curtobacterium flaccumfaciens pv. betae]MCS0473295.1 ABC transporter permease [Curtobacterium flaccumfaciens pv. betae]MCS0478016.1 ABC transporter permease [Curtobacterium flaccumfaciens pv. betae]MCS0479943.1 ABC transporter permease [Curtobacterium flaccumfaciens pv. betae]MCS0485303.1 ABC transporter permease [Curtobacterium flaccumfaciens pv. betae]